MELARPRSAETWVQGFLTAAIYSERGALRGIDLTPRGTTRLEHGTKYQVVVTNPHDLGDKIRKVGSIFLYILQGLEIYIINFHFSTFIGGVELVP